MLANNFKVNLFLSAWKKYLPVIRILIKKSVAEIQMLDMNRSDFEKDTKGKSNNKFVVNFVSGRPHMIGGNEIVRSFIYVLLNDDMINELLLKGDYAFTLNNKYQLQIKNNSIHEDVITEPAEEMLVQ